MRAFIFAENRNSLTELCAGAAKLWESIEAVAVGRPDDIIGYADTIWTIREESGAQLEDYTESLIALVEREKPDVVVTDTSRRCALISARVAAALGTSVISEPFAIEKDFRTERLVYGGAAVLSEKPRGDIAVIKTNASAFGDAEKPELDSAVREAEFVEPAWRIKVLERVEKPETSVRLDKAKRVIAVGRGIAEEKDLDAVRELAALIGAEVGCTRPVAEGEGWMPKENYIGVSGVMLNADLYIGMGVSGQIQHTVGANGSKVFIAINKDESAPIFKQADYGIVADLYKILPALISHMKGE